jgi:hypothetical protein
MKNPMASSNSSEHKKRRVGGAREISIPLNQKSFPNMSYRSKRTNK